MAYRSSGASNDELVNNLKKYDLLTDDRVYEAMLRVDRGYFAPDEARREAYFDQPFLHGKLHMSAPHIYGTVLCALDLQPGMSFLNIGSGTGYLSTLAGCLLEGRGVNHGVDLDEDIIAHSQACHDAFITHEKQSYKTAATKGSSDVDVTQAQFFLGSAFNIDEAASMRYDRIYVGAACPSDVKERLMRMLSPRGGVLVGPMGDELVRIVRETEETYSRTYLAAVRFAPLRSRPALPMLTLPRPVWSPQQHFTFPSTFRSCVRTVLMAANRPGIRCSMLPKAVWMEVMSFMDRGWFETEQASSVRKADSKHEDAATSKRAKLSSGGHMLLRSIGGGLCSAVWAAAAAAASAAMTADSSDEEDNHHAAAEGINGAHSAASAPAAAGAVSQDGDGDTHAHTYTPAAPPPHPHSSKPSSGMPGLIASLLLGISACSDDDDDHDGHHEHPGAAAAQTEA